MPAWLITFDECPSTNTWALEHLDALAPGCCVFTPRQTAGRGRDGRTWLSPPGVLTASWVVSSPPTPLLALVAGLALMHAVEDHMPGLHLGIKWPNDLYCHDHKLAGILIERPARHDKAVIGIGCNHDAPPHALPSHAISLAELGTPPPIDLLLSAIRSYLEQGCALLRSGRTAPIIDQLNKRNILLNKDLRVSFGVTTHTGIGADIAPDGTLHLRTTDGVVAVRSGHVTILEPGTATTT